MFPQVEEGLQGDADTRQDILSQLLPVLAEAVTPSNMSSNIFPQDLITVNSIVETVLASLIEDVVDGAATNLQTVRTICLLIISNVILFNVYLRSGYGGRIG